MHAIIDLLQLSRLESCWNMEHGTLKVNSFRNVHSCEPFPLAPLSLISSLVSRYLPHTKVSQGLHRAFDRSKGRGWLWLPIETDILKKLDESTTEKRKFYFDKVCYRHYTFIIFYVKYRTDL